MGRLPRAGRQGWRVRLAGVTQSQEHHAAVSRGGPRRGVACARDPPSSTARSWRSTPTAARRFRRCTTPRTAGLSVVYYAFDLLHLNGRDLTAAPLDDTARGAAPDRRRVRRPAVGSAARDAGSDRGRRARSRPRRGGREAAPVHLRRRPAERRLDQSPVREASGVGDRRIQAERERTSTRWWSATTKARSCCAPARCAAASRRVCATQVFERFVDFDVRAARSRTCRQPGAGAGVKGSPPTR